MNNFSKALIVAVLLTLTSGAHAMSLQQAVKKVQRETNGKILAARTEQNGQRQVHKIKVLMPSGRVRIVTVQGDEPKRWQREYWKKAKQAPSEQSG